MPKPHIPDLDRVPVLDDEVRFYATIGIIVSVSGALERTLFQFYEKATGEMAAPVYYRARTDADRREMTNKAMRRLLAGSCPWLSRLDDAAMPAAARVLWVAA